jgi:hypothetical protein
MKSLKTFSILLLSFILFCSFNVKNTPSYVGKWEGMDKGEIGFMTLTEDGYAMFEFDGQIMGGKSSLRNGIEVSMRYKIEENDDTYNIDFIVIENKTKEIMSSMLGIFKMNSDSEMILALNFGEPERPKDFESNKISLNKID